MYLLFLRDLAFKKRMHFSLGTVLCLSQEWASSSKNLHILREIYYLFPCFLSSLFLHPWWKFPQIVFPVFLVILSFFFTMDGSKISKLLSIPRVPKPLSKINLLLLCFVFCVQDQDQNITKAKCEFSHRATAIESQVTFLGLFNTYMTFLR